MPLVLLLLLAAPANEDGVELPAESHGAISASLGIRVEDQPAGPGLARVRFRLRVNGPDTLQVDAPVLEDALAGWRVARGGSSWSRESDGCRIETTLDLVQVKPGFLRLPGLRVRARENRESRWIDLSWPEPLHQMQDVCPIEDLPKLPSGPNWLIRTCAILGLIGISLGAGVWVWQRYRRRDPPRLDWRSRLARLEETDAGVDQVLDVVRDEITQLTGLSVRTLTTPELLQQLQSGEAISPEVRDRLQRFLELGELVKFAGLPWNARKKAEACQMARDILQGLSTGKNDKTGETGEVG